MEAGRTAGEGRGLVAGVRAAFRGRPREGSKVHCDPLQDEAQCHTPQATSASAAKSQRSLRSPILGWRKLKHKENHKGKECARSEEARGPEKSGQCSRSQALRLSYHSTAADYTNYPLNSSSGEIMPSEELNDGLSKKIENNFCSREVAPWQVSKMIRSKKEEKNDSNSCYKEQSILECTIVDAVSQETSAEDNSDGAKSGTPSSDICSDHQGTVIRRKREGGSVDGKAENEGALCRNKMNEGGWIKSLSSDDKFRNKKCLDQLPLVRDREPWLRSALSYSLRVPQCPRNEVVVLALGVDQYVEEVFRFLDKAGEGKIGVEGFHILCRVLGLEDEEVGITESKCSCSGSTLTLLGSLNDSSASDKVLEVSCPAHLSFKEFRERLCEVFIRNADAHSLLSLGARRPANSPLVNSVVSVQRRYEVLEAISRKLAEVSARLKCEEERLKDESNEPVCGNCQQGIHVDRNSNISPRPRDAEVLYLQQQVLLQQQELQCLREVIDDLRVALQSSDAENLALQVQALKIARWRQTSFQDLSMTDEENTIDNLVRQLAELDPQSIVASLAPSIDKPKEMKDKLPPEHAEAPAPTSDTPKTTFSLDDTSLEDELQSTYEALQVAREEQEATQADLQQTVTQLQQREADLQKVEGSLQSAQSALSKAHNDNVNLVQEVSEARTSLQESRCKLSQALNDLKQTKEIIKEKEKQLDETQLRLDQLRDSKSQVVQRVGRARELVAGSLSQVKAGEHALNALAAHTAHTRLEDTRRADSGLYSEDSERDEDTCQDRSSEHASEEDLWSLRESDNCPKSLPTPVTLPSLASPWSADESTSTSSNSSNSSSDDGYKTEAGEPSQITPFTDPNLPSSSSSKEIIEGLERELEWLQFTLEEAEKECEKELSQHVEQQPLADQEAKTEKEADEEMDDRTRLCHLQEQLRQLLEALMSVADMNLSRRTLGRLVLEAVQDASGESARTSKDEEPPISLLTRLLSSLSFHPSDKQNEEGNEWLLRNALSSLTGSAEARERVEVTMG